MNKIPTPADAQRLQRINIHSQSPDAPPPTWDDVRFLSQFLQVDLDNIQEYNLPLMEHKEIQTDAPNDMILFDQVSIESGALKVTTTSGDRKFPLLRFMFSSTGPADPLEAIFIGSPLVLDDMRRLLRDAVRLAIRHANIRD
jgi:hypothetical protein